MVEGPGQVTQLVKASSCTPKGCGFYSWSGHIPRLWVPSLVRAHMGGNQFIFLSHIAVFLFLPLPLKPINWLAFRFYSQTLFILSQKELTHLFIFGIFWIHLCHYFLTVHTFLYLFKYHYIQDCPFLPYISQEFLAVWLFNTSLDLFWFFAVISLTYCIRKHNF